MTVGSEIERYLKNSLEFASGPPGPSNSRGHAYAKVPEWQLRQWLASALRAPEAADGVSVAMPTMWVCFAADAQFIRAWTKDGLRAARFVEEGLDMIAFYASPTAAGIAAPPEPVGCGPLVCEAARKDGVICADDECDRVNGVRPTAPPAVGADTERAVIERASEILRRRAAGYDARATSIFNGRILADELKANARDIEALADTLAAPVAGADTGIATWADLSRVLSDLYDEIGCAHDNEAAMVAISTMVDLLRLGASDMTTAGRYAWKQQVDAFLENMSRQEPESDAALRDRLLQAPGVDSTDRGVQCAIGEALDKIAAIHGIERYVPTGKIRPNASLPMEPPPNNVPDK